MQNHKFLKQTKIVKRLAEQELVPEGVAFIVHSSLLTFLKQDYPPEQEVNFSPLIAMAKPKILEAILEDWPEALEYLRTKGHYTLIEDIPG